MKRSLHFISLAVLTAACSGLVGEAHVDSPQSTTGTGPVPMDSTTTSTAAGCTRFTGDHSVDIDTGSLATDALTLSGETFVCADDVVVVGESDLNEVAAAAQLAAAVSGPLLFPEPRLAAELGRLKPRRVHVVGNAQVNVPSDAETIRHDVTGAVDLALSELGSTGEVSVPTVADSSTIVETVTAIVDGDHVARPEPAAPDSSGTVAPSPLDTGELIRGLAAAPDAGSLWVVDAARPKTILLAAAIGHVIDASVVAIDGGDILGYPELGTVFQGHAPETVRHIGSLPAASDWELAVLANDVQLPGGGFYILPKDHLRRYVSYYGNPETVALGALGEQGPAETIEVMKPLLEAYAGDGAQVVPAFEIIASVASAGPTDDGDYSYEWPVDTFADWIDFAAANGVYVVLDLQPGRDDFLSQATQYEELLKLPFVGLAIDPEWRLKADQVHLRQVGTVDASEINQTVNWLADLVHDNGLPQKMVVVHQFRTSMVTNRSELVERPEIQMIVQMDGDGLEAQKDDTWAALLSGAEDAHWAWGWKNFFDEDEPGPPSPESTMSKVPTPVYVSYQ